MSNSVIAPWAFCMIWHLACFVGKDQIECFCTRPQKSGNKQRAVSEAGPWARNVAVMIRMQMNVSFLCSVTYMNQI